MTDETASAAPITASIEKPITVARLREWLLTAKPGARMIWARGPSSALDAGALVCRFVQRIGHGGSDELGRETDGLGLVTTNFSRCPVTREGRYLITRTKRPLPLGGRI